MMSQQFIRNINVLKEAIAERKLVIFAGAGISIDAGIPSWGSLIEALRSEINIPDSETDFLRIAQMYFNERQQKELIDKIRTLLKYKKVRYNEIHESLFELNPEHIITTNFDDLLEQVIKAKAHPFSVIKKDSEFPYSKNTKLLVKIHGDLEEANLVLKEDDYLSFTSTHPLIESFIKGIFATKVVLFIGYSFSDINLKIILQSVRNILGSDFQNAYMLDVEDNFHPAKRQYLKNKGINVINYHDAGLLFDMNYIEQYLFVPRNALNHKYAHRNSKLSTPGARLLYLLKFISKYHTFAESLVSLDPVSQMSISLSRFNEIRVLPPNFLGNRYPFNNTKRYLHNYNQFVLATPNKAISDFFFTHFDAEKQEIKETYFTAYGIDISEKHNFNSALKNIIRKLNFSLIYFFGRSAEKLELYEYPKDSQELVPLRGTKRNCECLSCLYNDFRIKEFLAKLKEHTITETSDTNDDLLIAYANYKAANYKAAYDLFEVIANKAWQLGQLITYYIAQQNLKFTGILLHYVDDTNYSNLEMVIEKIEDLDLEKLIFQLPNLGDDEYKFLKLINADEVLTNATKSIDEAYHQVEDTYHRYLLDGFKSGPCHYKTIRLELYKVFCFYTYNYLLRDEFKSYRDLFSKGIKALFISYATDSRHSQKLEEFDAWALKFIILYGDDEEVKSTIYKYHIDRIDVAAEDRPKLMQYLNNILESIISESPFWNKLSIDSAVSIQTKNLHFQHKLRNTIHNGLLIFSRIDIPEEYRDNIVSNFIKFIQISDILLSFSIEYINSFLNKIKDYCTFDQLIEIIKISTRNIIFGADEQFYAILGAAVKNRFPDLFIDDEKLIKAVISSLRKSDSEQHYPTYIHLWQACSEENKKIIHQTFIEDLENSFSGTSYLRGCLIGVIRLEDFAQQYINYLEQALEPENNSLLRRVNNADAIFLDLVNVIYYLDKLSIELPFRHFAEYPEIWKFYLKPLDFDYNKFEVPWLCRLNKDYVHQKLKSISQVKVCLLQYLQSNPDKFLSEIYCRHYL